MVSIEQELIDKRKKKKHEGWKKQAPEFLQL